MIWQRDSDYDENSEYEAPEEPRRRSFLSAFLVVVLVVAGVASAFAWRVYLGNPFFALESSPAARADSKVIGGDVFQAFQQKIAAQLQSNAQELATQRAEVNRLSEQIAAMSAKIDALQSAVSMARAAMPAALPVPPKPKPKPSARTSTGGAPLPPPVELTR